MENIGEDIQIFRETNIREIPKNTNSLNSKIVMWVHIEWLSQILIKPPHPCYSMKWTILVMSKLSLFHLWIYPTLSIIGSIADALLRPFRSFVHIPSGYILLGISLSFNVSHMLATVIPFLTYLAPIRLSHKFWTIKIPHSQSS